MPKLDSPLLERPERIQMMLSQAELAAIDNFRFEHRMPSRAAALREILRRGLLVVEKVPTEGAHSADFGVLKRRRREAG
jgi:hypothetical protein